MTQGTIIPPAVDQDSIEYGHVYANYVKSVADTPGDPDANPDIIHVNGQVTFDSTFPGSAARGSIRLPASPRAYGLIVTGDTFEIANSKLVDHEGRAGVRLVASVDGVPISWQAVVTLEDKDGRTIYNKAYVIHYDLWHKQGNLLDINLPDLIPTPSRLEPPEGAAIELAERTIEQIEALSAENRQINIDVSGLKSEVVTLHGQTGQRLTAAEAARAAAVTAKNAAEAAQSASETARTGAETARTGAETARTGAQTARTGAEAAKGQIDLTHDHIHQDVNHADTHALAAGAASQTAITKASEASNSAGVATTKASEAAQSRADALTYRNTAQGAATTATNKAGEASASAQEALGYRDTTKGYRDTTKGYRDEAEGFSTTLSQRVETGTRELGVTSDGKLYFLDQTEMGVPLRVDTTVGTRVFLGNTMIHGDTGWRNISDLATNLDFSTSITHGMWIRRMGDVVHLQVVGNTLINPSVPQAGLLTESIPLEFSPIAANGVNPFVRVGSLVVAGAVRPFDTSYAANRLRLSASPSNGDRVEGFSQWPTRSKWPTYLPGTAIT